jgi:S-DNA-T family DNA segregation ATPase FtsK/SpoIIIE
VRNGPGPVAQVFMALARVLVTAWLGVAHAIGGGVRRIGHTASELEPEHRRDGAGLFLVGLAVVVAAAVWWQLPGGLGDFTRTVVAGSVGLLAWFVPLLLCFVAWRNLRDPETNGPVGRQVIGWTALLFGVLGIVHIANGSPTPELGDTAPLQQAGGAIGFVVSKLLLDLLQTAYVVVPLLVLLTLFGLLVVTATPVYQVPARLRELGDRIMGRQVPAEEPEPEKPAKRTRGRRSGAGIDGEIDPEMGDPAYDTPVIEDRELGRRGRKSASARVLMTPS